MRAPMLIPLSALCVGILLAIAGTGPIAGGLCMLGGCMVFLIIRLLSTDPIRAYQVSRFHPVWILLMFAGLGILTYNLRRPYRDASLAADNYRAAYGVVRDVSARTSGDLLEVDVFQLVGKDGDAYPVRNFTVLLRSDATEAVTDDEIIFPAKFEEISDNPDSFKKGYTAYLSRKGIHYRATATGHDIHIVGTRHTLRGLSTKCRDALTELIETAGLRKDTQNFLITILLGDRSYLDAALRTTFADAGVSHMLALSGMHVAIIASIIMALLFPLNFMRGGYRYRLLLSGLLLFGYAFVAGFGYSIVRACIMCFCVISGVWTERKSSPFNALLTAVFIIVSISPQAIFDAGLQLSFLCVASLIFFAGPLNSVDRHIHPKLHRFNSALICVMTATFGSWALTAYLFGSFPVAFIPANLIILPLLPVYLSLAILYFALSCMGIDFHLLGVTLDFGFDTLKMFVSMLNGISGGSLCLNPPVATPILWFVGLLLCAVAISGHHFKNLMPVAAIVLAASIGTAFITNDPGPQYLVCSRGRIPAMNVCVDGEESRIHFQSGTLSRYDAGTKKVLSLDCNADDFLPEQPLKCSYLILTRSFTGEIEELKDKIIPDTILLHPTMSRAREKALAEQAEAAGIPPRSLRNSPAILR